MEIKILYADDQEMLREYMYKFIEYLGEPLKLIGAVADGREAVEFVKKQKPDVIIMDIDMPVMDGIDATREIKSLYPDVGIIAYSAFVEGWRVHAMMEVGAKGYLVKTGDMSELGEAVKKVFNGEYFFTKEAQKYSSLQ